MFAKKEGEFVDKTGEVICFAPSVHFDSKPCLLIKKEPFLKYLRENKLRIFWTVLGEKNILGSISNRDLFSSRLEISGAYYLDKNNEIDGGINTKNT